MKQQSQKLYRNFNDAARQHIDAQGIHKKEIRDAIMEYSKWLDGFQVATDKIELMVVRKAWEIDREAMHALIDRLGVAESEKIIKLIVAKHRHFDEWENKLNKDGAKSSHIAGKLKAMSWKPVVWLTWFIKKSFLPLKARRQEKLSERAIKEHKIRLTIK